MISAESLLLPGIAVHTQNRSFRAACKAVPFPKSIRKNASWDSHFQFLH
jgi:hypothetical protein